MKKSLNWNELGRFIAILVSIYTLITETFKKLRIGIEICAWLIGDGKEKFVASLTALGEEYFRTKVKANILHEATVDTDATPRLPFDGVVIESHVGMGKVLIQKRTDGLYVDGRKVLLHRVAGQIGGKTIRGHELRTKLGGVLNACVEDFLLDHTEFIPDDWKKDDVGNIIFIYFWGTIYRRPSDGRLFVRCLCWGGGAWVSSYVWLGNDWDGLRPAAVLAK
jgi:hypothetical protein